MSQHIIHYFDSTGRADVLKLIAEVGSVPYTFNGIKRENWPSVKPTHRYGQVPALTISAENKADTTIYHTVVIARYLAQEGGLYPSDRLQATQSEEYVATVDEAITKFIPVFTAPPEKKEEEVKKFNEGTLKTVLGAFSGIIEKNGYLCGELTWADLVFFDFLSFAPAHGLDLSPYKTILEFKERIGQLEKVKAYNESDRNLRNRK